MFSIYTCAMRDRTCVKNLLRNAKEKTMYIEKECTKPLGRQRREEDILKDINFAFEQKKLNPILRTGREISKQVKICGMEHFAALNKNMESILYLAEFNVLWTNGMPGVYTVAYPTQLLALVIPFIHG